VRFISLALDLIDWLSSVIDCAEGTVRQFQMQHRSQGDPVLKAFKVTKLFVTHMHGLFHRTCGILIFTLVPF
jgi:ribonuclease Z